MAYTDDHPSPANVIILAPQRSFWITQELELSEAAQPGHLMEKFLDTTQKLRKTASAVNNGQMLVLLDNPLGEFEESDWTGNFAIGDFVEVAWIQVGYTFVARIPTSETVLNLSKLEFNAAGQLVVNTVPTAAANLARFQALQAEAQGTIDGTEVLMEVERFC